MKAKANDKVKVHYTGKLTSGEVFDSSEGRDPLEFTVGGGQMIKGFDEAVNGMELKEKKTVTIPSAEAYGERREELIQEVPKDQLPEDMNPEVGQKLVATNDLGHQTYVSVTAVTDQVITVDANHELAGKDLVFDIELVEIG
ncbi:FKBP-type peptidyl-prolyl cis-trans isomerase [Ekhidna sp.]